MGYVENYIVDIKTKFGGQICMMGDFNACIRLLNDVVERGGFLAWEMECDLLAESKCQRMQHRRKECYNLLQV